MKTTETPIEQKPAHTPGPWGLTLGTTDHDIVSRDPVAGVVYIAKVTAYSWGGVDRKQGEANANRIITCVNACDGLNPEAVPELLAALERICDADAFAQTTPYKVREAITAARLAIAKAKGTP